MSVLLLQGNALRIPLAEKSVHCVVTSPPFYGLRDYGTAEWVGGDESCDHRYRNDKRDATSTLIGTSNKEGFALNHYKDICKRCGAIRADAQLGLEPTLQEYIDNTVLWCREVWRVLRDDGTFWLNLGSSYAGSGGAGGDYNEGGLREGQPRYKSPMKVQHGYKDGRRNRDKRLGIGVAVGLKPKDDMLVPHRVAIALQSDGWWVRSDIVWHKPNPMPESVRDRPTKSHEYIFLLTKRKNYYYDADAIREQHQDPADIHRRIRKDGQYKHDKSQRGWMDGSEERANLAVSRGRNKRSVWTMTTKPYKGAHFATFPPELPETCIKAGTSEKGVCPVCGSQWARVIEKPKPPKEVYTNTGKPEDIRPISHPEMGKTVGMGQKLQNWYDANPQQTIGWKSICSHNEEPVPATILDPFCGSATAIMVARQLGRNGIGIDLSWEYLQLARERTGEKAWKEWVGGMKSSDLEGTLEELPLFSVQNK